MKSLIFDVEGNSLEPTKLWCICTHNTATGEKLSFDPDRIDEGVEELLSADKLIGHNILGYDLRAIESVTGVDLSDKVILDTMVVSRLFNPTREGGHSLESWGHRLGFLKGEYEEFDTYHPDMLLYCARDVELNRLIYEHLHHNESKGFSRIALDVEHNIYKIIQAQMRLGFKLDVEATKTLNSDMATECARCEDNVHKTFPPRVSKEAIFPRYTQAGKLSKLGETLDGSGRRLTDEEYNAFAADASLLVQHRYSEQPFNLGSGDQIAERLMEAGWVPKEFTPKGKPQTSEKILSRITNIPEAAVIVEYNNAVKIKSFAVNWLDKYDEETHRIHGFVNPLGAVTHRMTHSNPNLGQIPRKGLWGSRCRLCFIPEVGYVLVGIDASGLEARMLAHRLNDENFTREITEGKIHDANKERLGLESRDTAKSILYAFLYGAQDPKLGSLVNGTPADGKRIRAKLLHSIPSLAAFADSVKRQHKKGYLIGLDGRRIKSRSPHSALNTQLQSDGAIVMKHAQVIFHGKLIHEDIDPRLVATVHDEWQIEALPEEAEIVGSLGVQSIIEAGLNLNLACPLDGEYKIGNNWNETH